MDKKGETSGIAWIIMVFVAVVVGVALLTGGISSNVSEMTSTRTITNGLYTAAAEGADLELSGKAIVGSATVTNRTDGVDFSTNFTTSSKIGSDGNKNLYLTTKSGATIAGKAINVTYTYQPDGYAEDGASRAIIPLIIIFFALALAVAAIPNLKEYF